jgi:phosphopantothenoylcysteine synthetase/decarboxylase
VSDLTLVVCGAPLATRTGDVATALESSGWLVTQVFTSAATNWLGSTAHESTFRHPEETKSRRPDAIVVCPMTFNTANKWASGVADTAALSLLCEALGAGTPIVAVPFVNESLEAHPAWAESLALLQDAGVRLVDPASGGHAVRPLASGTGNLVAEGFDPSWVIAALER